MIQNKRVLITGVGGSIGSELARQLHKDNIIFGVDINETEWFGLVEELGIQGRLCDIRDQRLITNLIVDFKPDIVFHAAALKHVTPSMQMPREYVKTNLLGTLNVIEGAAAVGAKFINISTDKAVTSENVMGWTKKGTEMFTKIAGGISVRFGNVLGSRGSVIPLWQKQIEDGKPVTVTDPRMTRYMMSIEEAVSLVIQAAETGNPGELFILDLDQRRINVLELAKQIISGTNSTIQIIGARPGEALSEFLMTYDEKENSIKEGPFYIIGRSRVLAEPTQ